MLPLRASALCDNITAPRLSDPILPDFGVGTCFRSFGDSDFEFPDGLNRKDLIGTA